MQAGTGLGRMCGDLGGLQLPACTNTLPVAPRARALPKRGFRANWAQRPTFAPCCSASCWQGCQAVGVPLQGVMLCSVCPFLTRYLPFLRLPPTAMHPAGTGRLEGLGQRSGNGSLMPRLEKLLPSRLGGKHRSNCLTWELESIKTFPLTPCKTRLLWADHHYSRRCCHR